MDLASTSDPHIHWSPIITIIGCNALLFYHFFCIYIIIFFCTELPFLSPLHLSFCTYSNSYKLITVIILLDVEMVQIWPVGTSKSIPVPLDMSLSFFEHFLAFWHRCFKLILNICCPRHGTSYCSDKLYNLFLSKNPI